MGAKNVFLGRMIDDPQLFKKYMRMSKTQFEELLKIVGPLISKETVVREQMYAETRICV